MKVIVFVMVVYICTGGLVSSGIEDPGPGYSHEEPGGQTVVQADTLKFDENNRLSELTMYMDMEMEVAFNYSLTCSAGDDLYVLVLRATDIQVLQIDNPETTIIDCALQLANFTNNISSQHNVVHDQLTIHLQSGLIGFGPMNFELYKQNNRSAGDKVTAIKEPEMTTTYVVTVLRKMRPVDVIFRIVVYCAQIFVTIGFGVKLDIGEVKKNLKKPIAPGIGFGCQYIMMPMIAYGLAKLVTGGTSPISLGIFVAGCCPGGGASNMYSLLLNGDLSLSITMTTISTVAALGMLPLWVYTLGTTILEEELSIPFKNIAIALSIIILPLLFGVLLKMKFPKVASKVEMILKPVTVVIVLVFIVVGIYSNLFIFRLFRPRTIIAGCLLPYIGYFLGGLIAFVCRQSWTKIKTIAIETGMQNTSIAYILLTSSFPPPLGDIAAVAPMASAIMTPLPPFLASICYITYNRCRKRYGAVKTGEPKPGKGKGHVDGNEITDDDVEIQKLTTL